MQKAVAMSKYFRVLGMMLISIFYMIFSGHAAAENASTLGQAATRINGESLIYFLLLACIVYLFFRKPTP